MQDYYAPIKFPLNIWDKNSIRPGPVASVGDTLTQIRLKQSAPDLNPRYAQWSSDEFMKFHGTNVQDGRKKNFMTGGDTAKTVRKNLPFKPGFKTQQGWIHQDIVPTDRTRNTKMGGLPQFGWKSQVASVLRAKVSGESFLPVPQGYKSQGLPRGGQYPRIIDKVQKMEPLPSATRYIEKAASGLTKSQQKLLLENKPVGMNDIVERMNQFINYNPQPQIGMSRSSISMRPPSNTSIRPQSDVSMRPPSNTSIRPQSDVSMRPPSYTSMDTQL